MSSRSGTVASRIHAVVIDATAAPTRRHRSALGAVVLAGVAMTACGDPAKRDPPPASPAAVHYEAGMERMLRFEVSAAREQFRRALRADPGYLPAMIQFVNTLSANPSIEVPDFADSLAALMADRSLAACYARLAARRRGVTAPATPAGRESDTAAHCALFESFEASVPGQGSPYDASVKVASRFPEIAPVVRWRMGVLQSLRRWDELAATAKRYTRLDTPPIARATAWALLAIAEHERGRDDAAVAAERDVRADPAWSLPGFRVQWADEIGSHAQLAALTTRHDPAPLVAHVDSTVAASIAERVASAERGDVLGRLSERLAVAVARLDRGRIDDAVRELEHLRPLADSVNDPGVRAYFRMRLGRAYVKRGRHRDAERELLFARAQVAPERLPYVHKEIEHNLLHLYESLGRDADATDAGQRFVRYASMGQLDGVQMMSERDFGLFLRARGRVGESRPHLERMLAYVDSLRHGWFYSGEYRELTGDHEGAADYYGRALRHNDESVRALEGLVRVSLATGDSAEARRWAEIHDARRDASGRPESAPLLPGVIARTGALDRARLAFDRARRTTAEHGQVAGWAALTADLAALELDAGAFARASVLADSAAEGAAQVGASEAAARGRALSAAARAFAGGSGAPSAMRDLRATALALDRSGSTALRAEVHRLTGAAHAASGRWREALDWFARAAMPLDSTADGIAMDPRQAAFRSAQRRVYDDAITTIVRHASEPGAATAFALWSSRRKGRAYATQSWARTGLPRAPAPGSAIVDFVLLDSILAALTITPGGTTLTRLPVHPDSVRADIGRLRRALDVRVGSKLDIARARFPLGAARRLHHALIAPLLPHIGSARNLTIVPDGMLGLVPFDALVTSPPSGSATDESGATFLIDRFTIRLGATMHSSPGAWIAAGGNVIAIAPSGAPGGERELDAIRRAVRRERLHVLAGDFATQSATLAAAGRTATLHFVVHAHANERDPGASWIDLAAEPGNDGRLLASEIAELRVYTPLVVLSACETAGGRVLEGEGVLSLGRSFLRSGARAVIATLWPVGTSSADFAGALYASLGHSDDLAGSLRAAKLSMRASGAPAFAWAPYQLLAAPDRQDHTAIRVAARD